nr:retrovirus-related Pol polyprotein from transposon TNT 1-94 [Tanacetum cinerariifolium]
MSWTRLPEFADDTITDNTRPSPKIESNSKDLQINSSSVSENGESTSDILSKPEIKFMKATECPTVIKTNKDETVRKPSVKYAEIYRKTSKSSNVRGNQRNWNNLKSQQLGKNFLMKNKACFNCGEFDHLSYDCGKWVDQRKTWAKNNYTHKSKSPKTVFHKTDRFPTRTTRPNMNAAQPKRTSVYKPTHSYVNRPVQRKSTVKTQFRVPRVSTVNRKFPTVNGKFPTSNSKLSTVDLGNKGKAVKALACWIWKPKQNSTNKDESELWHRRLGHLNFKTMNKLVMHNLVRRLPFKCFNNDHTYVACLKRKQHKASCKTKVVNSVTKPLHTLHMDLFGPTSVSSLNYKWYCLVVTDDFSRFTWTFFLKTKDETSGILRNFITEIENLKDLKVKIIKCDNGGEFRNKEMNDFCLRKRIKREFSNARTPQQNGVAERRNRTLIEAARTMLADAKLPVTFWAEAVNTACYVQNRVLINKSQNKTPYELFNGRTPAIGFLKPFGCHVMIFNTLDHLGKFEAKGDECYFIGYSMSSKAFRVFNKRTKRVEENLHVEFLENKLIEKGAGPNWLFDIDTLTNSVNYVPVVSARTTSTNFLGTKEAASQDVKKDVSSLRYIALPNWFHEAHLESSTSNAQDAYKADAHESSGNFNPTATSTNPPTDQIETLTVETSIPTVLKNKKDERGIVIRNKARLVAQGHTHEEGIDYEEVFAPVARIEAIRLFLACASFMGFTVYQMDVKSAFLYGTIDEEVYVMQPPGFQDPEFPARVYKVEKAMYGLHQTPRAWSANTLMDKENPWGKDETGKDVDLHLYRSMIGSLMYLTASRPDIMFDVCACARHQVTPKECHLHAVKRIFRYLKSHPKLGIWYPKDSPFDLVAYSDSDYSGATQDRKSTIAGC